MSIERIKQMEEYLDECTGTIEQMYEQLNRMEELREKMTALFQYYGSEEWYEDREGEIPQDLKAGVLSEDLVYDAIMDVREEAFRMLELGTDILKNRI